MALTESRVVDTALRRKLAISNYTKELNEAQEQKRGPTCISIVRCLSRAPRETDCAAFETVNGAGVFGISVFLLIHLRAAPDTELSTRHDITKRFGQTRISRNSQHTHWLGSLPKTTLLLKVSG
jgi:hypothetical protein